MTPPMPPARRNSVTTIPNEPWPPLGQLIPRIIDVKYQIPCVNGLTWRGLELQSPAAARRILEPIYSRFPFFGKGYISECTDKVCYNCFLRSWYFLIDSILIALNVRSVLCFCVQKLCILWNVFFWRFLSLQIFFHVYNSVFLNRGPKKLKKYLSLKGIFSYKIRDEKLGEGYSNVWAIPGYLFSVFFIEGGSIFRG